MRTKALSGSRRPERIPLQSANPNINKNINITIAITIAIIIAIAIAITITIALTMAIMRELVRVLCCLYKPAEKDSADEDSTNAAYVADWLLEGRGIRPISLITVDTTCEIPPPVPPKIPLTPEGSVKSVGRGAPVGTATASWSHPVAMRWPSVPPQPAGANVSMDRRYPTRDGPLRERMGYSWQDDRVSLL
jgi:hypothetical protein